MTKKNIFEISLKELTNEVFDEIINKEDLKIERIISRGHKSPKTGWYDQETNEWVLVLKGKGRIMFDDGEEIELSPGDYIDIPASKRHKVSWTDPDRDTVWLAVHYI